jgi:putative phosphoribosyl transferase
MRFKNRQDAGQKLARLLSAYDKAAELLVLALPRGGVPVAFEIAKALHAPLDVFIVRKLGVPGQEELAFGALASGATYVLNDDIVEWLRLSQDSMKSVIEKEKVELERRERAYRGAQAPLDVKGKTVIVVDDGAATGATLRVAVAALKRQAPKRLCVAVATASREAFDLLSREADEVMCVMTPEPYGAVGSWYQDFSQVSDDEVKAMLLEINVARDKRADAGHL